jgi:hypothetical protein
VTEHAWASVASLMQDLTKEKVKYEALATKAEALLDSLTFVDPIPAGVLEQAAKLKHTLLEGDK